MIFVKDAETLRFVPRSWNRTGHHPERACPFPAGFQSSGPGFPRRSPAHRKKTCPVSGRVSPTMHLSNTLFPVPLAPMIRLGLPFSKTPLTSFNTGRPSNAFDMFFTSIIPRGVVEQVSNLIQERQSHCWSRPACLIRPLQVHHLVYDNL